MKHLLIAHIVFYGVCFGSLFYINARPVWIKIRQKKRFETVDVVHVVMAIASVCLMYLLVWYRLSEYV